MGTQAADEPKRLVRLEVADGVGHLVLDDPAHRNALSKRLSDDLAAAVDAALDAGARALVLSAHPQRVRAELAGRRG